MCTKGSGPHSAANQGRSFRVAALKASRVPVCPRRPKPHSAAKQGRSFRVAALNWVLSLRIEKWTLECSCVPKGVGTTFCSKTGPFFSCGCSKLSCASCAYASILETLKDLSLVQNVWVASRGGKN